MSEKSKNIFRWVTFLPGGYVAGLLSLFPLHWILYYLLVAGGDPDALSIRFFTQLFGEKYDLYSVENFLSPILLMFVCVLVTYEIAPKFKFIASVSPVVVWFIIIIFAMLNFDGIQIDARLIFTLIAMLLALCINWNKSRKETIGALSIS
jgi:hypothetical protein